VTQILVAVNVIVFFVCELLGDTEDTAFMIKAGALCVPDMMETMQYWRLFTAMFLHFGIQHIVNNMLLLYCAGEVLEYKVGRIKYLLLYLISGLAGNVVSLYLYLRAGDYVVSAGASGAVFGVFGGLLALCIKERGRGESIDPRRLAIAVLLALVMGFRSTGTNNAAHLVGVVAGFMLGMLFIRRKRGGGFRVV